MARKRHKPEEIIAKLRQVEVLTGQGKSIAEAVKTIAVTETTYFRWRAEFGGMKTDQVKRMKALELENARLRRAVSDLTLDRWRETVDVNLTGAFLGARAQIPALLKRGGGSLIFTSTFVGLINQLSHQLPDLQAGLGAVIRLRQMLAVEPEPKGGAPVPAGAELAVEVRGLDFSYTEGSFALRDVTFAVPAGETVALVGRTGSGKSTLASFVSRAIEPPRGTVFVGGVDVRDLDVQLLRTDVGVVTQRTEIIAGTLADNIALFDDTPRDDVESAVRELGLGEWVEGLPDGLDTVDASVIEQVVTDRRMHGNLKMVV